MDTLIQYGGDTIGVVTDNTDITLDRDFITAETYFDLTEFFG